MLSFALIVCYAFIISSTGAYAEDDLNCKVMWKDGGIVESEERWNKIDAKCMEETKFDESKLIGILPNTTLEEFDVDDSCYVQCCYKTEGILTPEGAIDKKKTASIFKGNLTAEVLEKTSTVWESCIDDAEKVAASKGLDKCKMATLQDFCFTQRAMIEMQLFTIKCD